MIGVTTTKTSFSSEVVVNCAGAWAGEFAPVSFPTRPVKGQMLSVVMLGGVTYAEPFLQKEVGLVDDLLALPVKSI